MDPLFGKKIYVAGHNGMVGKAVTRLLKGEPAHILTADKTDLNLLKQDEVKNFFYENSPDIVVMCAAHVGGIKANEDHPADFLFENLQMQNNIIHNSFIHGTAKLVFLGSSCIYPKICDQPIKEDCLLTGPLEPTNEAYAIAKIAGIKMCDSYRRQHGCNFVSVTPCNLYGPGDNYDPITSHVIPALIKKFHDAKQAGLDRVVVWGTGSPQREFLHVDDCARGILYVLREYNQIGHVNLGSGKEISILQLAQLISTTVGFLGTIEFDSSYADGTPRKVMDSSKINALGWTPLIDLKTGIKSVYEEFFSGLKSTEIT